MAQPELNPRKYLIYLLFFKHINILTMGLLLFSTTMIYLYFSWKNFLSTRFFFQVLIVSPIYLPSLANSNLFTLRKTILFIHVF